MHPQITKEQAEELGSPFFLVDVSSSPATIVIAVGVSVGIHDVDNRLLDLLFGILSGNTTVNTHGGFVIDLLPTIFAIHNITSFFIFPVTPGSY